VQLSATSHFTNDLGLDSLDTVEVVMAIEEVRIPIHWKRIMQALTIEQEFSIEIPDKEADAIHSGMFQWRIEV
jgi:NADH dehydrogenase (ubiquinone) 1 alpha/beta subcomplex 1